MKYKDERIRLINEVLNGIKVVKLSAWETAMEETIERVRDKELKMIKQSALLKTFADCLNVGAPVFVGYILDSQLLNMPTSGGSFFIYCFRSY